MNTNALKKFAQEARRKLLEQVGAKLEYVLHTDTPELREKADQVQKLKESIQSSSKQQIIDKVTYTWFNRFMALRFMDANDYQPIGIRVLTPKDGFTLPELLDEAKQGHIPEELSVKNQRIYDLLDGKIPSSNAQNEAYKDLLIGACNHLNKVFPFLFERINDYTELLLPDDLTSELSIIQDIRDGMSIEDCAEVEVIGWLYQFYISEKKEELINAKKVYKADEIAPVTQLFTPKWIVEYMVDNTLGQYWKEARPNTNILNNLQFYIKPNNPELIPSREIKSPEDIKFFDTCVGSAHVLCYAFDIFYKIYEEEGYDPSTIPELIISKNLYGIDIDDRASQLAGFALMMKGRKHSRRFFKKDVNLNITSFQNIESHPKFENAKVLGSLIKISKEEVNKIKIDETSLFYERELQLKTQAELLSNKYDIIVTNPPYLSSGLMNPELKKHIEKEFKNTKSDLFACFLMQTTVLTKKEGLIGFICPYTWMFNSSYEFLREYVVENTTISSLIQLEYNAFGPAVVPIGTFVLRNTKVNDYLGSYIRLAKFTGEDNQAPRTLEAIKDNTKDWFYLFNQDNFSKIQTLKFGYWAKPKLREILTSKNTIEDFAPVRQGFQTGDNDRFIKFYWEINYDKIGFNFKNTQDFHLSKKIFAPYNKGGGFRKWYGNNDYVVLFDIKNFDILSKSGNNLPSKQLYFNYSLTWSSLSSSSFGARFNGHGFTFSAKGACAFPNNENISKFILGLLNSRISSEILSFFSPTLDFNVGDIRQIPIPEINKLNLDSSYKIIDESVEISRIEWDSKELSWSYKLNDLFRIKSQDLEETYELYQQYWKNKFIKLNKNEVELNSQFIEIYGLQDELIPDVPLKEITILKEETVIQNGQLVFKADEVFSQFISYAVGCMFGRYSLDKEGLILANQGETLEDYLAKVEKTKDQLSFTPDDDNIIPVLDDEWFEDDITGRFYAFLKASFGAANFDKNLAFVEECLGKDVRKYFVKDFYNDHIKRYKKRPIYWMFSSPKGSFNVLIYMHRYTPDTINKILNGYLIEYREKLNTRMEHLDHLIVSGSSTEQTKSQKEKDKLKLVLIELQEYERETLRPLAIERINIYLDEGVLVNYNKFGAGIKEVKGLNDKPTKKKVREFDWIDVTEIR